MHRNRVYRAFAGIMSVWLVICLVEPAQLHTCAMHGGLAIGGAHASAHGTGSHGASTHHSGSAPAAASTQSHQDRDSDSDARQCSCLGDCSVGKTPLSLPGTPGLLHVTAIASVVVVPVAELRAAESPHFLLPFANGPPGSSSRA